MNGPKRELCIFTPSDFEIEQCGADNGTAARDYSAGWVGETFGVSTGR